MPNVTFHAAAEKEYLDAFAWYHGRSELAANRFEEAVARTLDEIAAAPERGLPFGRKHRCRLVKRFPYHIVYRTDRQPILIVAVAHGRRRPLYWRNRQGGSTRGRHSPRHRAHDTAVEDEVRLDLLAERHLPVDCASLGAPRASAPAVENRPAWRKALRMGPAVLAETHLVVKDVT